MRRCMWGRFCIGYGFELSRLVSLTSYHVKRKFKCQAEWEKFESWAPGAFTYHQSIPNDLLILTLALCYAVIAPMILIFAFLYFLLGWLVQRNQVWHCDPSFMFLCKTSLPDNHV